MTKPSSLSFLFWPLFSIAVGLVWGWVIWPSK